MKYIASLLKKLLKSCITLLPYCHYDYHPVISVLQCSFLNQVNNYIILSYKRLAVFIGIMFSFDRVSAGCKIATVQYRKTIWYRWFSFKQTGALQKCEAGYTVVLVWLRFNFLISTIVTKYILVVVVMVVGWKRQKHTKNING